eukprot:CAMPEP_0195297156 /NCGR_PEP_ID=MMETSP0707-20130614/20935_1 /TAXON_ID=33640 /ORGANISM="Asterionellopsis glacialis, Strain CCMP134" /LENGTH=259 /DNA_ID=CAMNT_0040358879 /DNA_START=56 /DNA_END=835 /DNA_ORIENTATION=-
MKSTSPSSTKQIQQRPHVTFANNDTVHDIESHRDYSVSERQDTWYSASELTRSSSKASSDARRISGASDGGLLFTLYKIIHKKMESNNDMVQLKLTNWHQTTVGEYLRGIEHLADERLNQARNQDRQKVKFAVLYLQRQLQESCGHVDQLKLAKTCMVFSLPSIQFATTMGKADELSVLASKEKKTVESSPSLQPEEQQHYYEEPEDPFVTTSKQQDLSTTAPKRFTRSNRIPLPAVSTDLKRNTSTTARITDTFPKAA